LTVRVFSSVASSRLGTVVVPALLAPSTVTCLETSVFGDVSVTVSNLTLATICFSRMAPLR